MAAEEEEVAVEVQALEAVYGDDCVVLNPYPPHLHVHIKPRTADVTSQQFVEAVIGIRASSQYPKELPCIDVIDSKGLDEQRQKHLVTCIRDRANELSSCLMLVALCEDAVEKLSSMNHPDGDCPLCLYPLVPEHEQNKTLPFMKLMSCFHCFHSECIIRWWKWLRTEKDSKASDSSSGAVSHGGAIENKKGTHGEESMGDCPVCRKVFHAADFEHVLDLVGNHSPQLSLDENELNEDVKLLQSDSENNRRQRFEAILMLQKENRGIIEHERTLAIVPGMFLPQPVTPTMSSKETASQHQVTPTSEAHSSGSSDSRNVSRNKNSGRGKQKARNSKQPVKQWIRKENGSTG